MEEAKGNGSKREQQNQNASQNFQIHLKKNNKKSLRDAERRFKRVAQVRAKLKRRLK